MARRSPLCLMLGLALAAGCAPKASAQAAAPGVQPSRPETAQSASDADRDDTWTLPPGASITKTLVFDKLARAVFCRTRQASSRRVRGHPGRCDENRARAEIFARA